LITGLVLKILLNLPSDVISDPPFSALLKIQS